MLLGELAFVVALSNLLGVRYTSLVQAHTLLCTLHDVRRATCLVSEEERRRSQLMTHQYGTSRSERNSSHT